MLLIFQATCVFYFSSCCLSVCASGKRRLPKRLIFLVEGRIKQKRLLWYDLWRRQSIDVWSWVWWRRASSFILVPCQILDLNNFHQKEFLAGRNWAYIQVWSPDFCLHWVTMKMTLTPSHCIPPVQSNGTVGLQTFPQNFYPAICERSLPMNINCDIQKCLWWESIPFVGSFLPSSYYI